MTGLVVKALADPDLATERRLLAPFGTTRQAEWSTPALVLVGIIMSYFEPDAGFALSDDHFRQVADGMRALAAEAG
jgi:hypothetical protein